MVRGRRTGAILGAFALIAGGLIGLTVPTAQAVALTVPKGLQIDFPSCTPYIVYGVRGSGEQAYSNLTYPGNVTITAKLGSPITAMTQRLLTALGRPVGIAWNSYPAAGVDNLISASQYISSVNTGKTYVVSGVKYLHALCPTSALIVVGYSQGAHAVRLALPQLDQNLVKGSQFFTVLFADPLFKSSDLVNGYFNSPTERRYGFGDYIEGKQGLAVTFSNPLLSYVPMPPGAAVASFCHYADMVCQTGGNAAPHATYGADAEAAAAAAFVHVGPANGVTPVPLAPLPYAQSDEYTCSAIYPGQQQTITSVSGTVNRDPMNPSVGNPEHGVIYLDGKQLLALPPESELGLYQGQFLVYSNVDSYESLLLPIADSAMHRLVIWTVNGTNLKDRLLDKYIFTARSC